jgi:hypothetical protein
MFAFRNRGQTRPTWYSIRRASENCPIIVKADHPQSECLKSRYLLELNRSTRILGRERGGKAPGRPRRFRSVSSSQLKQPPLQRLRHRMGAVFGVEFCENGFHVVLYGVL